MANGTAITCPIPRCRAVMVLPVEPSNVQFEDNSGGNLMVKCTACGREFDAAPADAVYSTVEGRLHRVEELVERLRSEAPLDAEHLAAEIEATDSRLKPLAVWVREHKNELLVSSLRDIVVVILTVLISQALAPEPKPPGITNGQMEQLIEELQEGPGDDPPVVPGSEGR